MTLTRDLVYGRNAARELYRGPRQVLETWVTERAAAQIPWLDAGPRPQVKPERLLSEAAGTRDHQGVVAWCEPFRYADAYELAGADGRSSSASTRSRIRTTSARSRAARTARARPRSSYPLTARCA